MPRRNMLERTSAWRPGDVSERARAGPRGRAGWGGAPSSSSTTRRTGCICTWGRMKAPEGTCGWSCVEARKRPSSSAVSMYSSTELSISWRGGGRVSASARARPARAGRGDAQAHVRCARGADDGGFLFLQRPHLVPCLLARHAKARGVQWVSASPHSSSRLTAWLSIVLAGGCPRPGRYAGTSRCWSRASACSCQPREQRRHHSRCCPVSTGGRDETCPLSTG